MIVITAFKQPDKEQHLPEYPMFLLPPPAPLCNQNAKNYPVLNNQRNGFACLTNGAELIIKAMYEYPVLAELS
jgi:hypothetical protein